MYVIRCGSHDVWLVVDDAVDDVVGDAIVINDNNREKRNLLVHRLISPSRLV